MFKKLKILVLIMIPMLVSSCEDWLNLIPPDGLVRDEYWQSKEDLQTSLMGAYSAFAQLDATLFLLGELRGDLLTADVNLNSNYRDIMNGNIYPDNILSNWSKFYTIINYCNSILKYAPIIQELDQTFTDYMRQGFESEAIFLRSLAYFYLVRSFRDVPLVLEASESDNTEFFLPVSTAAEVLAQIKADLIKARQGATADYGTPAKNKGRASKAAINALLADISLWNFQYTDCISFAEAVEAENLFVLPGSQWFDNFYPGNSLESIFEFQFDASLGQPNRTFSLTYLQRNFLASETALEFLEPLYSKEIIRGDGSIRTTDLKIWKYAGAAADGRTLRTGDASTNANWIVYRMSDLLLMKAEALSQLNRFDEALAIVNDIRNKRLMLPLQPEYSPEAFEDMILEERAHELAFEGKRWFDLLRMGRRNDFQRKSMLIEYIIQNVPSTQKLLLSIKLTNPSGWYLPIEADELNRNFNLVQNPYYAGYDTN